MYEEVVYPGRKDIDRTFVSQSLDSSSGESGAEWNATNITVFRPIVVLLVICMCNFVPYQLRETVGYGDGISGQRPLMIEFFRLSLEFSGHFIIVSILVFLLGNIWFDMEILLRLRYLANNVKTIYPLCILSGVLLIPLTALNVFASGARKEGRDTGMSLLVLF